MRTPIIAGDTLAFDTTAPTDADGNGYKASDGWTMTFRLVPRSGAASVISFDASADGDDYTVSVTAATTANWAAGWYTWSGYVTKAGTTYTFEGGQLEIKANPRTAAAGLDGRGVWQQRLEAAQEALATYTATNGHVAEYEIAGRRMKFKSATDIKVLIEYYEQKAAEERTEERLAAGMGAGRKVYTRFTT